MIEDEKLQVAVFRFAVISDFVIGTQMSRAEKRRLMRDKKGKRKEKERKGKGQVLYA